MSLRPVTHSWTNFPESALPDRDGILCLATCPERKKVPRSMSKRRIEFEKGDSDCGSTDLILGSYASNGEDPWAVDSNA